MNRLSIWIYIISALAFGYEMWALLTGAPTISRLTRDIAEIYHPVYWFGGIVTGFLIVFQLYAIRVPILMRVALLFWIMTSAHIFWGLYEPPNTKKDSPKTTEMMSEN